MECNEHQLALERAHRLLRGHTSGTLLLDGLPYSMLYMVDPRTGSLVLSIENEMANAQDAVLVVPEDTFDAPMRVSIELDPTIQEEACDRFLAYHLHEPGNLWAHARLNFAKLEAGEVLSGEELEIPNPLVDDLPGLCKKLNSDRSALAMVCRLLSKADIPEPTAVGIDPIGFDVRGSFGVVRVEFPSPVGDAKQAEDVLGALLGGVL
ncbi:MAG: DUF2470 domain-containing protein [Phycisphaerales bacterium]